MLQWPHQHSEVTGDCVGELKWYRAWACSSPPQGCHWLSPAPQGGLSLQTHQRRGKATHQIATKETKAWMFVRIFLQFIARPQPNPVPLSPPHRKQGSGPSLRALIRQPCYRVQGWRCVGSWQGVLCGQAYFKSSTRAFWQEKKSQVQRDGEQ